MMYNSYACPLCASAEAKCLENIKIDNLDKLYYRATGYSISHLFGDSKFLDLCRCVKCDLQYFYPMVSGSQEFYESLQKFDWYYFDDKPEFNFATSYINSNDSVLEIGAGKGSFAKKIPLNSYTGLEFSQQAIKFAQKNGVRLLAQSVEDYSKEITNKHDVVCNFQVLEHVSDVNAFLSSSVNCLKDGGLMIISVPAADSFSRYVRNFCLDMPPHHLTRWTDLALTNVAKQYGLELVTIHHENLQVAHKEFYATTIFSNAFSGLLKKPHINVDLSFSAKLVARVSAIFGRLFSKGLVSDVTLPRGLSLVAVYRKPING
jgi:2-polyprenyl-3-methyl-5-hydroxy-6-metoxy-1,4-benzoquinol methylase